MNDIEKAIEEFKDRRGYYLDNKCKLKYYDLAIEALEKQLNNEWIPIKERMPSYDDIYIVNDGKDIFIMNYDMCLGWGKYKFNKKSITFKESKCNVIAWRELPKPYEVGE